MRLSDQLCQSVGGTATHDNDKPGTNYHCDDEINFAHTFLRWRKNGRGLHGEFDRSPRIYCGRTYAWPDCAHGLFGV